MLSAVPKRAIYDKLPLMKTQTQNANRRPTNHYHFCFFIDIVYTNFHAPRGFCLKQNHVVSIITRNNNLFLVAMCARKTKNEKRIAKIVCCTND
jgi:hypothetical protein